MDALDVHRSVFDEFNMGFCLIWNGYWIGCLNIHCIQFAMHSRMCDVRVWGPKAVPTLIVYNSMTFETLHCLTTNNYCILHIEPEQSNQLITLIKPWKNIFFACATKIHCKFIHHHSFVYIPNNNQIWRIFSLSFFRPTNKWIFDDDLFHSITQKEILLVAQNSFVMRKMLIFGFGIFGLVWDVRMVQWRLKFQHFQSQMKYLKSKHIFE